MLISMRFEEVPNRFEIKLNNRNWIFKFVVANDLWVQDSNSTNGFALQENISSSFWEVLSILLGISVLSEVEMLSLDGSNLGHQKAQSAMNNFERS